MEPKTYEMLSAEKPTVNQLKGMVYMLEGDPTGMTREQMEDFIVKTSHEAVNEIPPARPAKGPVEETTVEEETYDWVDTAWPDQADKFVSRLPQPLKGLCQEFMEYVTPREALAMVVAVLATKRLIFDREGGTERTAQRPAKKVVKTTTTVEKKETTGGTIIDQLQDVAKSFGLDLFPQNRAGK